MTLDAARQPSPPGHALEADRQDTALAVILGTGQEFPGAIAESLGRGPEEPA